VIARARPSATWPFQKQWGSEARLQHLRDIGYVTVKGHIGDLPDEGDNLSDFVTATPVGKQFIEFRETGIVNLFALMQYQGEREAVSPPLSFRQPGLES
jgi:hypothetical protein